MKSPTDDEVNAVSKAILKTLEPLSPLLKPTLIELGNNEARLLPRQPPLASMEWSTDERERMRTFMSQATRMKRISVVGKMLRLFR